MRVLGLARVAQRMVAVLGIVVGVSTGCSGDGSYDGRYCSGTGDAEFLQLIDQSFGFLHANPEFQNISMLYNPDGDWLVEGASWGAWWIQNSYGPTLCGLPFLQEPYRTFLQHSQDFWFRFQGDGKSKDRFDQWKPKDAPDVIAPDGCLVDCAGPEGAYHRQGDGNWMMHDWGFEFTAAGIVMQAELLLVDRDMEAIKRYISNLERACEFIETRRDAKNGLFLVGPAANLLAPSYGGIRQPDGSFGKGYLSGLSITYAAALDRMVELYRLTGDKEKQALYESRRKRTYESLPQLLTSDGYFVKSLETDGTKHGVLGQEKYGYFEGVANADAIGLRVVDMAQSEKIYAKLASIPELRPHGFLITNYPSLDDLYENYGSREVGGLWEFGRWVNGGVWHTVEARALLAYYRLGKYEDVRKSMKSFLPFARNFQADAPLTEFGKEVWFRDKLTNFCYDALGVPTGVVRGLFEYVYKADSLVLYPHIPPSIREYAQREPVRWGTKRIAISVKNAGPKVASVKVNGRKIRADAAESFALAYDVLPENASVEISMTGGWPEGSAAGGPAVVAEARKPVTPTELPEDMRKPFDLLVAMQKQLAAQAGADYERAFLAEAIAGFEACREREAIHRVGMDSQFTRPKRAEILQIYHDTAMKMLQGFENLMKRYSGSADPREKAVAAQYEALRAVK